MNDIYVADYCLRWIDIFLSIAMWLLIGAGVLGAVMAIVEIYVKWKSVQIPPKEDEAGGAVAVLPVLKELVEAMAKAPSWIALFIAGIALVWISSSQVPAICRPAPAVAEKPEKPEKPADGAAAEPAKPAPGGNESGG